MERNFLEIGKKYLITTDNWFIAPNGRQYRSVFGTVKGINDADSTLGLKTNRNSTNWYVIIGGMVIAGCQIHYLVETESIVPEGQEIVDFEFHEGEVRFNTAPSRIYRADEPYNSRAEDPVKALSVVHAERKRIAGVING